MGTVVRMSRILIRMPLCHGSGASLWNFAALRSLCWWQCRFAPRNHNFVVFVLLCCTSPFGTHDSLALVRIVANFGCVYFLLARNCIALLGCMIALLALPRLLLALLAMMLFCFTPTIFICLGVLLCELWLPWLSRCLRQLAINLLSFDRYYICLPCFDALPCARALLLAFLAFDAYACYAHLVFMLAL